jgi:hypothetical protein
MAEPNKPAANPDEKKPEAKSEPLKPLSVDVEKDLRAENSILKEKLHLAETQNKALEELIADLEKARSEKAAKKSGGPKIARALQPTLGEGRRQIAKGGALRATELEGLVEGEHYTMSDD